MKNKLKKIIFIFILLTGTMPVFSQGSPYGYETETNNALQYQMVSYGPNSGDARTPFFDIGFLNRPYFEISYASFTNAFQFFFDLIIGVSIATAVILFMVAAFKEITGRGDIAQIKAGKEGMVNAIVGLMIVLSTWLIINTINPDLVRLPAFGGLGSIKSPTAATTGASERLR